MKRRGVFLFMLGSAAVWFSPSQSQQTGKLPTVGMLGAGTQEIWAKWIDAFKRRLGELGWIEGRTLAIEYRWAEGHTHRFAEIASEFVRLNVNVIVTVGSAVPATMQATSTIPIVFAIAVDPVRTGMVRSLARPGGNVTGLSLQAPELVGKRIELLREVLPDFGKLATMGNAEYVGSSAEMRDVQSAASKLGIDVQTIEIRRTEDIVPAFRAMRGNAQALYVCPDALVNANLGLINSLALDEHVPTMLPFREYLGANGLMSYGADNEDLFRRAADYVDKILRGANPADIPIEQPTKFELIVNLKTAKALGITIPPIVLAAANELIE